MGVQQQGWAPRCIRLILDVSSHNSSCLWSDAVVVQVLKRGDTKKYFAKLLCIGDDCDLALMVNK